MDVPGSHAPADQREAGMDLNGRHGAAPQLEQPAGRTGSCRAVPCGTGRSSRSGRDRGRCRRRTGWWCSGWRRRPVPWWIRYGNFPGPVMAFLRDPAPPRPAATAPSCPPWWTWTVPDQPQAPRVNRRHRPDVQASKCRREDGALLTKEVKSRCSTSRRLLTTGSQMTEVGTIRSRRLRASSLCPQRIRQHLRNCRPCTRPLGVKA